MTADAEESVRVDAARYRWLRAHHWSNSRLAVVENPNESVILGSVCPTGCRLDAIIDDEMKREER